MTQILSASASSASADALITSSLCFLPLASTSAYSGLPLVNVF